jgi:hypothetical protein
MDTTLAAIKDIAIVRVLVYLSQGMNKKRACDLVGISVDVFDDRYQKNPAIAANFLAEEHAKLHKQYSDLMDAREKMVTAFIEAGLDPETPLKEKLAIDKHLIDIQAGMELELGLTVSSGELTPPPNVPATDAETFIANMGPVLKRATGKAVIRETTVEFDMGQPDEPIIDAAPLDSSE